MNISHRDVKPDNILMDNRNFLIGDLDSIKQKNNESLEKTIEFGTLAFTSPELMKNFRKLRHKNIYNAYKSDVFSLGLCLLYVCTFTKFTAVERQKMSKNEFI
jgi:serine/threonine protein kinase